MRGVAAVADLAIFGQQLVGSLYGGAGLDDFVPLPDVRKVGEITLCFLKVHEWLDPGRFSIKSSVQAARSCAISSLAPPAATRADRQRLASELRA